MGSTRVLRSNEVVVFRRIGILLLINVLVFGLLIVPGGNLLATSGSTAVAGYTYDGQLPNNSEVNSKVSDDGRYVFFSSPATNLVANDTNGNSRDIFVRDTILNTTEVASIGTNNTQTPYADDYDISPDGRTIVFVSNRNDQLNLNYSTMYVRNLDSGITSIPYYNDFNGQSIQAPALSDDGQYIAFQTRRPLAGDIAPNVYRVNTSTNFIERISSGLSGATANAGSSKPSISADGSSIAFSSLASNLVLNDTAKSDIFLWNQASGGLQRISVTPLGQQANGDSEAASISADGSRIAYITNASNIVGGFPAVYDGQRGAIYWDKTTNQNTLVSTSYGTLNRASKNVGAPYISGNGAKIVYTSASADIVESDTTTNAPDVFMYDIASAMNEIVGYDVNELQFSPYGVGTGNNVSFDGTYVPLQATVLGIGSVVYLRTTTPPDTTAPLIANLSWQSNPLLQGADTILTVQATDSESDIDQVTYTVNGGSPQTMVRDLNTGDWVASFGSSLIADTYEIEVVATDAAGNLSEPVRDILAVYVDNGSYVTGHTKIAPTNTDTLPIALDQSNNPKKLVVGFTNVASPTSGSFEASYVVKNNQDEFSLESTSINWVVIQDAYHATIQGYADMSVFADGVESVTNVPVRVSVAIGQNGANDFVTLYIYESGANPNTAQPQYFVSQTTLSQGKIFIK